MGEIRDILPPEKYPVLNISEYGMRANLTKVTDILHVRCVFVRIPQWMVPSEIFAIIINDP